MPLRFCANGAKRVRRVRVLVLRPGGSFSCGCCPAGAREVSCASVRRPLHARRRSRHCCHGGARRAHERQVAVLVFVAVPAGKGAHPDPCLVDCAKGARKGGGGTCTCGRRFRRAHCRRYPQTVAGLSSPNRSFLFSPVCFVHRSAARLSGEFACLRVRPSRAAGTLESASRHRPQIREHGGDGVARTVGGKSNGVSRSRLEHESVGWRAIGSTLRLQFTRGGSSMPESTGFSTPPRRSLASFPGRRVTLHNWPDRSPLASAPS